jgi:5-methylcytosine-specific restriction endonuclease McrA
MKCKACGKEFFPQWRKKTARFCSRQCANKAIFSGVPLSEEHKAKIREAMPKKEYTKVERKKYMEWAAKETRGKYHAYPPETILKLSKRTVAKILKRLNIGCSVCGWNKAALDIHHIVARKDGGSDDHKNLTAVCPNDHRLAQLGLIEKSKLMTLHEQVGERWKEFYFG